MRNANWTEYTKALQDIREKGPEAIDATEIKKRGLNNTLLLAYLHTTQEVGKSSRSLIFFDGFHFGEDLEALTTELKRIGVQHITLAGHFSTDELAALQAGGYYITGGMLDEVPRRRNARYPGDTQPALALVQG